MGSEGVFFSALQPNNTVSSYAVPKETHLPHGGTSSDESARARRVQQQVAQRLAEKSTLLRRGASISSSVQNDASEDSGSATMMKYQTYNPSFSSKSYMYSSTARPVMAHRPSQQSSSGYSSRSAMDFGTRSQMSHAVPGGLVYNHNDMGGMAGMGPGYRGSRSQQYQMSTTMRSINRGVPDMETASMHSLRLQQPPQQQIASWMLRNDSEGSLESDPEANYPAQAPGYTMGNGYAATYTPPFIATGSDFSSGVQQASMTMPPMRRSLSGTLARNGGTGVNMEEEAYARQTFKGPAQRTISRITQNRQNRYSVSVGSVQGGSSTGGFVMGGNGTQGSLTMMKQGKISRAPSMRSVISVGRGKDVFDGMDMTGSMGNLSGLGKLDLPTAINMLESPDKTDQVRGAAYIQHECYHFADAKKQVKTLNGIPRLVALFNSESQNVQQYATGAVRNLIYENMENKVALIEGGGLPKLMEALKEPDDELQKNITGILWNLSSKDNLKERVARESLGKLTEVILVPLSGLNKDFIGHNESEADIFFNTTGCLRNLSSVNSGTRQRMRETSGLIEALVRYLNKALAEGKAEEKGVENSVCVLRNLSYQLYDEIPPAIVSRLEGNNQYKASSPIGCFTPQSKKAKDIQSLDMATFSEVSKNPQGCEWLWHPKVVELYSQILKECPSNITTREATAGALQNITAGDGRWPSILARVALDQHGMLPVILNGLKTTSDHELRSLTGFLRNLLRHAKDKNSLAPKVVEPLVSLLNNGYDKKPTNSDVSVNICGALNNLVSCSEVAARDIAYFDGLDKLMAMKKDDDGSENKRKQSRAASTVLFNMFQYKKLHKDYKKKGYGKQDFMMNL